MAYLQKGIRSSSVQCTRVTTGMEMRVSRKLNADRYSNKYSAMNPMGWRENQFRFMGKASFLQECKES